MESQIRLTSRRQGCCESLVLLYRARYEVWRRPRHSSARDSVGSRLGHLVSCNQRVERNVLLLDRACTVPSDLCSARHTQTIRDGTDIRHLPNLSIECRVSRQAMQRQNSRGRQQVFSRFARHRLDTGRENLGCRCILSCTSVSFDQA